MSVRRIAVLAAAVAVAVSAGACDTASPDPAPRRPPSSSSSIVDPAALAVARSLTDALNRGDSAAARAQFTPDARFDSVGRVYPDRDAIFDRFIDPEVIALGGRYKERAVRTDADRLVVEYDFTTRSGGQERFTYAYLIRDGLITDVVGRYV